MQRTLVVVPTEQELGLFLAALSDAGASPRPSTSGRLPTFDVADLSLVIAPGGLGKTQFAVQTQYLLGHGSWSLVMCAGAAGALCDDLAIGDVVVATETVEHDIRKVSRRWIPRFAGHAVKSSVSAVRVHYGVIASGDEDVVSASRRRELREETSAIAVAWEGAGGARACHFSGVPYLEVRGITDVANEHGPRDFAANLTAAMTNAAVVVADIANAARVA
jgi:adenosylhomocysteine nucleosidase